MNIMTLKEPQNISLSIYKDFKPSQHLVIDTNDIKSTLIERLATNQYSFMQIEP